MELPEILYKKSDFIETTSGKNGFFEEN